MQLMGFVADESGSKYLYDGDYSVDSLNVSFIILRMYPVCLFKSHFILINRIDLRCTLLREDNLVFMSISPSRRLDLQALNLLLQQFSEKFLAGDLPLYRKSQKAPAEVRCVHFWNTSVDCCFQYRRSNRFCMIHGIYAIRITGFESSEANG